MKTMKRGENMPISKFIFGIGEKIEQVSGAKLNFSQEATVPEERWISEKPEKMLLKGVQLRTERQTQNLEVVELKKFDPCSLNENSKISCSAFGCQETTSRLSEEHRTKQDLFLCETHREKLTDQISKYFAKQDVSITNFENSNHFKGYASLIGALEKAFMHLKSRWLRTTTDALLAEVFLNTRNFLIITNALLNPNEDNITTALGSYLTTFEKILEDPAMLQNSITLLVVAMCVVCLFYGITYRWVHVPLENPGAKIGLGVGLIAGFVTLYMISDSVPFWLKGLYSCVGFPFATSLIGNGIWDWNTDKPFTERSREKIDEMHLQFLSNILIATADAAGNLAVTTPPNRPSVDDD